jgi:type IV pilus assembly protein PilY1
MNYKFKKIVVALACSGLGANSYAGSAIAFPDTPLTATTDLPVNLMLAISVEFPTMGSAYKGNRIGTLLTSPVANGGNAVDSYYVPSTLYVGYWRPERCYTYDESLGAEHFVESGDSNAVTFACNGTSWSGNFLNWAVSSAIDIFRGTLSGGYRSTDTTTSTVLERAFLTANVRGNNNYPLKEIASTLGPGLVSPSTVSPYSDFRIRVSFGENDFTVTRYDNAGVSQGAATFKARVKVCDSDSVANAGFSAAQKVTRLASNCQQYGTSYKPVGEMQLKANSMRFSVSGYLLDDTLLRDGGVIRAPMKSIGPKKTNSSGSLETNTAAEWDVNGVFITNPDGATEPNSGVLNYLNKFGLTAKKYKTFDNVGELYSESLRYLMYNRAPAPGSTNGITDAMKDGFPVLDTWPKTPDRIEGSCQANNIVLIGDINTHCDGNIPGGKELKTADCGAGTTPADKSMDATLWTNKIGAQESRGSLSTAQTGSGNRATYGWAGLAYWAHTNGIRGLEADDKFKDVKVTTYVVDVDEPSSIPLNQRAFWYAAKYGGFTDTNNNGNPDATEWEAQPGVANTYPKNYYLASNGVRLQAGLKSIFADAGSRGGANIGASGTSSRATGTEAGLFAVSTVASSWTGDLSRYPFTFNTTTSALEVAKTPLWTASATLTGGGTVAAQPSATARNIATYFDGVKYPFKWGDMSADLKAIFQQPLSGSVVVANAAEGERRVNYLRGDRSAESDVVAPLRLRATLLGDSGNSSPVYVGPPNSGLPDQDYATWAYTNRTRAGIVYLGTSEGMLHAFDVATGVEKFAFIPSNVIARVAKSVDKASSRKPTVDATPTVGDVKIGTTWKSVLVGGLGAGGKGVYALDVSTPSSLSKDSILWEFTEKNDENVGQIVTPPTIARLKDGTPVVMFGSGYNSSVESVPGAPKSADGLGYLFVLKIQDGSAGWVKGTNYWRIALGTNGTVLAPSGVANPAIAVDGRGRLDRIYLGDLDGTLWKVNAPGVNASGTLLPWPTAGVELFQASAPGIQPITTTPRVAFHPDGGFLVLFGTGRFLDLADRSTTLATTNSFYGIWDKSLGSASLKRTNLTERTLTGSTTRTVTGAAMDWSSKRGWYLDFGTASAERVVYSAELDFRRVDFTTRRGIASCEEGSGFFMTLDSVTGLASSPSFDSNGDGNIDATDTAVGYATSAPPGQASTLRVTRSSDPYAEVTYYTFVGGTPIGKGEAPISTAQFKKRAAKTQFGRVNFRQITEIKR